MDLFVDHVKRLGTLETQAFYSKKSFVEASMGEQAVGRTSKTWGMVRWVGRSPVAVI